MKQHVEITYKEIEQNVEYENLIGNVIEQCFKNEKS